MTAIDSNFDGYESYLYNVSSSYISSSIGVFYDASVPKTGSGTFADPFVPVSSSNVQFTNWYGSVNTKLGQIYSASLYDTDNPNRLVNLLPDHVEEDIGNEQFLNFMDMVGQQFDELWLYTKNISEITDRQNDLSKGFSKDLVFKLAKSLGWDTQDGKDLLDLIIVCSASLACIMSALFRFNIDMCCATRTEGLSTSSFLLALLDGLSALPTPRANLALSPCPRDNKPRVAFISVSSEPLSISIF